MAAKALKQSSTARMAELKADLLDLISRFEFETGDLVNTIELQGGDRDGVLVSPQEIDVYLEEEAEPPTFVGIDAGSGDYSVTLTQMGRKALESREEVPQ